MEFNELVGFQLVDLNDESMIVRKGDQGYIIDFECDGGDCCGYAQIKNSLLIDESEITRNPVITKVENKSSRNNDFDYYEDNVLITLFGEYKPIAEIEARAGSGSGWNYGAAVTVRCKPLEIDEEIVSW